MSLLQTGEQSNVGGRVMEMTVQDALVILTAMRFKGPQVAVALKRRAHEVLDEAAKRFSVDS